MELATTGEAAAAASQSIRPSPLLQLPNELLDAIVSIIAEDTSTISPWSDRRQGKYSLGNLALAIRRFQPFVRLRLLQNLIISSSERIEAVISWLKPCQSSAIRSATSESLP